MQIEKYLEILLNVKLNLSDSKSGEYKLYRGKYFAGTELSFIPENYFSSLLGYEPKIIVLKKDYIYYDLFFNNHRVMRSSLEILFTQYIPFIKAKGNVLLGGYGLGVLAKMLCDKESVSKITSIEYSGDIIKLCGFNHPKLKLIEGDFYSYIKNNDLSSYDYIYIDTFTSYEASIYPEIIIPIKRFLLENYPQVPFDFWNEDEFKAKFILNCEQKQLV